MMEIPINDYISISHNPHIYHNMTVTEYINHFERLPDFRREDIDQVLKGAELWEVTYILDGKYFCCSSYSYERCIDRINEFISLTQ